MPKTAPDALPLGGDVPGLARVLAFCESERIDQSASPQNDEPFEPWSAGYDAAIAVMHEFVTKAIANAPKPADVAPLLAALEFYADRKSWWSNNVEGPGRHQMGEGSMERMVGRPGTVWGMNFLPDAGDHARSALKTFKNAWRRK